MLWRRQHVLDERAGSTDCCHLRFDSSTPSAAARSNSRAAVTSHPVLPPPDAHVSQSSKYALSQPLSYRDKSTYDDTVKVMTNASHPAVRRFEVVAVVHRITVVKQVIAKICQQQRWYRVQCLRACDQLTSASCTMKHLSSATSTSVKIRVAEEHSGVLAPAVTRT